MTRKLIQRILGRSRYRLEMCGDGEEALERSRAGAFALLILDYQMPKRSGLQVIEELRSKGSEVPIVLISATFNPDVVLKSAQWKNVAALSKPFSAESLRELVKQLLD